MAAPKRIAILLASSQVDSTLVVATGDELFEESFSGLLKRGVSDDPIKLNQRLVEYSVTDLFVLIDSSDVLLASIPENHERLPSEQLKFDLEEQIPVDAEAMILSRQSIGRNAKAVLDLNVWQSLASSIQDVDVRVHPFLPRAMFDAQAVATGNADVSISSRFGAEYDWIEFDGKSIGEWRTFYSPESSSNFIKTKTTEHQIYCNFIDELDKDTLDCSLGEFQVSNSQRISLAVSLARNKTKPWISFVDSRLVGSESSVSKVSAPLVVGLSVCLLLVVVNVGLWIAGSMFASQVRNLSDQRAQIFKSIFPSRKTPVGVEKAISSYLSREMKNQVVFDKLAEQDSYRAFVACLAEFPRSSELVVSKIELDGNSMNLEITTDRQTDEILDYKARLEEKSYLVVLKENRDKRRYSLSIGLNGINEGEAS